jgi:secreted PhoX family phosphatase
MRDLTRRQLLVFLGGAAAAAATDALTLPLLPRGGRSMAEAAWLGAVTPVRVPHPLPIYLTRSSWLADGIGIGHALPPAADPSLLTFAAVDDVVTAPELEAYVITRWGDRLFPDPDDYVGYNHDYTSFHRMRGQSLAEGVLWTNHEYVSFPFLFASPGTPTNLSGQPTSFATVLGFTVPDDKTSLIALGEMLYNCGGSLVRIRKNAEGRYEAVAGDGLNRRIHGLSGLGINAEGADSSQAITKWGDLPHQQGDRNYLIGTGPAASDVFPLSSDGLGNRIIGTAFNCSGATTPWDTVLSCEENFQGSDLFFVGVMEDVKPDGTQTGYLSGTSGARFGQVGEKYGWVVEVDPTGDEPTKKHTALGRFRHENAALRAERGQRLVLYMGDDRRGGHMWKYVSDAALGKPDSGANSRLLEEGTLYVARFKPNGKGVWIPLELSTPTNPIRPTQLSSVAVAAGGFTSGTLFNGRTRLPRRNGVAGQTTNGGSLVVEQSNEATAFVDFPDGYLETTLGTFYDSRGAMLCDAYHAANLAGGTPCARPEDCEINPNNPREVFISMTDGAPGSDGYPDSRIFVVAKYSAAVDAVQHSGSLHKIIEDSTDGTGTTFQWTRFVQAGEAGAEDGAGFAQVDNLAFDQAGDLWAVNDISSELYNGLSTGLTPTQQLIDHTLTGITPNIAGVFGNSMLFCVPLSGPDAGQIVPIATGPNRCEFTGINFAGDTLIMSVQHPGEDSPIGTGSSDSRSIELLKLDGSLFTQTRKMSRGSNWPSNVEGLLGGPPRPAVIGVTRRNKR